MISLSELLEFGWPGAAARVHRFEADDPNGADLWSGIESSNQAMQSALDTLVEWTPGTTIPTGAEVRAGMMAAVAARDARALASSKTKASAEIDRKAEAARALWITEGSGQALAYESKRREAAAWSGDPAPDPANYPWARARAARLNAVAEAAVTPPQAAAVTAEWAARAAAWEAAGIAIEDIREAAKEDIAAAADTAAIDAIIAAIVWPAP